MRLSLVLLLLLVCLHANAFMFKIEPTKRECFYEEVTKNQPITGSFQVTANTQLEIDFEIIDPNGATIISSERKADDNFFIQAPSDGIYQFCFRNQMTTKVTKLVTFVVKIGSEQTDDFAKKEHLTPIEESMSRMRELLEEVIQEQHYMKARERVHRSTTESTNDRVLWWSMFEILAVVVFSLGQIFYLRKLMERKPGV
ncbi:hypothetical protein RCL1_007498 [Eukaryota sp. TZLM3-RCL]